MPGITRIAVLGNATNPADQLLWQEAEKAARPLALVLRLFTVQETADLPAVFDAIARDGANGVVVLPDVMLDSVPRTIVALAADHRLPAMYHRREYIQSGGLISYGPNIAGVSRRSAIYVDKILKGAKPADLPVEQPSDFEMVINLRTAKAGSGIDCPAGAGNRRRAPACHGDVLRSGGLDRDRCPPRR